MNQRIVNGLRAEASRGIEAVRRSRTDVAAVHFDNALSQAQNIKEDRVRRDEMASLAALFDQAGFYDLGSSAAEDSIELDRTLGLEGLAAQDLLELGNAHIGMENTAKAEQCFRDALAIFLEQKEFANAASATTNIAGIAANYGDMAKAVELLKQSLGHLEKESFDDTEIQTRIGLLQALELTKGDVKVAIENAKTLCSRFFNLMPEVQKSVVRSFVEQAVERYLLSQPDITPKRWKMWKAKTFPVLYV
jgi:tetratricopeptide (TPR) repeat protein